MGRFSQPLRVLIATMTGVVLITAFNEFIFKSLTGLWAIILALEILGRRRPTYKLVKKVIYEIRTRQ